MTSGVGGGSGTESSPPGSWLNSRQLFAVTGALLMMLSVVGVPASAGMDMGHSGGDDSAASTAPQMAVNTTISFPDGQVPKPS